MKLVEIHRNILKLSLEPIEGFDLVLSLSVQFRQHFPENMGGLTMDAVFMEKVVDRLNNHCKVLVDPFQVLQVFSQLFGNQFG